MLNEDAFYTNLPHAFSIAWYRIGQFKYMQLAILIDEVDETFIWVQEDDYAMCESEFFIMLFFT